MHFSPPRLRRVRIAHRHSITIALLVLACFDGTRPIDPERQSPQRVVTSVPQVQVVTPDSMHGWMFYNDQQSVPCSDPSICRLVQGPGSPVIGTGSAELATATSSDGKALLLVAYQGTRFSQITELSYSTYRQSADPGNNLAVALQFNADFDLNDAANGYQGRIVFEPYQARSGEVTQGQWQTWDAKAGKWWGTKVTVTRGGVSTANPCVQSSPCAWSALLSAFPNLGVHATYGAVVLKAGSGWPAFRGNVDNLTIGINGVSTTVDFELAAAATIPALPPSDVPSWVYADSNLVDGEPTISGQIAKNIVMVAFDVGVPVSDRAAALARIGGAVVGGVRLSDEVEGVYFVRPSVGSTPTEVLAAVDALSSAPGVAMAVPVIRDTVDGDFRRPKDGAGATDWAVVRSRAGGANWALESIDAPRAWGCSIGDQSTAIAVLDYEFHDVSDLRPNVTGITRYVPASNLGRHGTAVASIIGARGDNQEGITGVMWQADLRLYDRSFLSGIEQALGRDGLFTTVLRLIDAATSGARVVNVSGYLRFPSAVPGRVKIPDAPAGWAYLDKRVRPMLRWALKVRSSRPTAPIFVFSAGNGGDDLKGRDAALNGFAAIEQEFPSRVLVVAATKSDPHSELRDDSNFGPRVSIAAPGEQVMALDQNNQLAPFAQTSASAPLVSGVAGLLISFDPSLTTAEVRDLIVAGALRGGESANGIPYLNAYESLKLAARRTGAPLCGNRVFSRTNGDVVTERSPGFDEILFRSVDGTPYTDLLNVLHGGRRIQIGDYLEFKWRPNLNGAPWDASSLDGNYHENAGGAFLSWYDGTDHDGHTYVISNAAGGNGMWGVDLYPNDASGYRRVLPTQAFPVAQAQSLVCSRVYDNPNDGTWDPFTCPDYERVPSGWTESVKSTAAAFAPQGDFVLIAANQRFSEQIVDLASVPCTWFPLYDPGHCATYRTPRDSSVSVNLWLVDTSGTKPWQPLKVTSTSMVRLGLNASWLAIDESGTEVVWELGKHVLANGVKTCTQRVIEYIALPGHPTVAPGNLVRTSIPIPDGCDRYFGPATFAPTRIAGVKSIRASNQAADRALRTWKAARAH